MAAKRVTDIRNIVLVGHGAVGKTTLADHILFRTGNNSRAGSVDDGSSLLDIDDEEKERKSSISSSLCHFEHNGKHINLLDTPGYPDFIGQVFGAIRAAETAAVTISATSGIEVNTRRTFLRARGAKIGRMIILTRLDGDNIDFAGLLDSIKESFGAACIPLNLPVGLGAEFTSVCPTFPVPDSIPEGTVGDPAAVYQDLLDAVVEADEALMERYLEGEEFSPDELMAGVSKAVAAGTLIPIFCVCGKSGVGVDELLDGFAEFAPSPLDVVRNAVDPVTGDETPIDPNAQATVAQVFKTRIDPFVAKMSFIRVYSGRLSKDSSLSCTGSDKNVKLGQLLQVQGGSQQPVESAGPGDIVCVVKMDDVHTSDMLTKDADVSLAPIPFPTPMVGLAVEPKSRADQSKISAALSKIQEEDATFRVYRDPQTKEMVMQGLSELHLQVAQDRLHRRDKVDVVTRQPKVPYRETVVGEAEGSYRHRKQSGGSGQFAEVHLRVTPCPRDVVPEEYFTKDNFPSLREFHYDPETNSAFLDRVTGGSVPNNFIPAVEKGMKDRMDKGVLAGYHVQDVVCELYFGKDHPVDSNETAFKMASSICFRDVFKQAKPALLEPIVDMEITIPADKMGDISSDLTTRRGRVEGMEGLPGGLQILKAKAPLSEVMTYARSLSSMTGGQGSFSMELSHYEPVPVNEQQRILAAAVSTEDEED